MLRPRPDARPLALAALAACLLAVPAAALTVAEPRPIAQSTAQNPTMGIPRWKGWMDPAAPPRLWAVFAGGSSGANNLVFSANGGEDWSTEIINPGQTGSLDYHVSLAGRGSDLFLTFPANEGIQVRHMAAPATGPGDLKTLATLPATTPFHRSNVMVDGDGRVWTFTRRGDTPGENVRYHHSDDDGATWTSGMAVDTGTPDVRFGSMPYVDGRACLVVLHLNSDLGYRYYLWDGTAFRAEADHVIRPGNVGYSRAFTHNVTAGRTFHLVLAWAGELHHYWKDYAGGTGTWNHQVLDTQPAMDDMEWAPITAARGDELYLFYSRWNASPADARIYVRRWTPQTPTWEPAELVSTGTLTHNTHPNTSFQVPVSSLDIPVFWTSGPAQDTIMFNRVTTTNPIVDVTPPADVADLKAVSVPMQQPVAVSWTAPGDDADLGQAASYDLRYANQPLTLLNWRTAAVVPGLASPRPAGSEETVVVTDLKPGTTYYFGLITRDEADNVSGVSNPARVTVGGVAGARDVPAGRPRLGANRPNPFNPATVIPYRLPRAGHVRVDVFDGAGRRVARLLSAWREAGDHRVRWDGRADDGRGVASGTYFCRLECAGEVATSTLTLVR